MERKKLGIYIHIPFCERKCSYCGFLSFPLDEEVLDDYIGALCCEIFTNGELYGEEYVVDTIFIGGGTPSLLSVDDMYDILESVRSSFTLSEDIEITIESNPNSITEEKLLGYIKAGVNRLSIGIQSFDDDILKNLGRIHDKETALKAFKMARNAGFKNINIDLMFAVPGQNMEKWIDTLNLAILLNPEHISFYSLQIEENTPFYKLYKDGNLAVDDDDMEDMYLKAVEMLKFAGYEHYEISNASKKGYNCRHNLKYWHMDEYLGFGLGACGYMNNCRFENPDDIKEWEEGYRNQSEDTLEDAMAIFAFTALRTAKGIDLEEFERRFGIPFFEIYKYKMLFLKMEEEKGNLKITDKNIYLTTKGMLVSNDIMCEFV